jgi:hypothetical protein
MTTKECIIWHKAKNSSGYGVTWHQGKQEYIHRVVAKAKKGDVVLHLCDNKLCINPEHLSCGSYSDNSSDMVQKGRQAKGEQCGNSKLKEHQVKAIRKLNGFFSSREVANLYNISKTNVLDIWNNKTWTYL